MENVEIKKELKKCQDMLAESQRKVTTLTVEKTTRVSMAESAEEGDINHHIKCNHCELVFRNQAVLEEHIKINHLTTVSQRCNACNKVFNDNNDLEIHMVDQHSEEADCSLCNAFFKKEEDVMMHSNNCSEVIGLNTCNKCEKNVISKAALKKHMPGCQGKKQREACRNGEFCRYHKANRCLFFHPIKRQNQATSRLHQQPNPDDHNIQPPGQGDKTASQATRRTPRSGQQSSVNIETHYGLVTSVAKIYSIERQVGAMGAYAVPGTVSLGMSCHTQGSNSGANSRTGVIRDCPVISST